MRTSMVIGVVTGEFGGCFEMLVDASLTRSHPRIDVKSLGHFWVGEAGDQRERLS